MDKRRRKRYSHGGPEALVQLLPIILTGMRLNIDTPSQLLCPVTVTKISPRANQWSSGPKVSFLPRFRPANQIFPQSAVERPTKTISRTSGGVKIVLTERSRSLPAFCLGSLFSAPYGTWNGRLIPTVLVINYPSSLFLSLSTVRGSNSGSRRGSIVTR
jgi:hypothetical protein